MRFRSCVSIVYNRSFVYPRRSILPRATCILDQANHNSSAPPCVYWRVEGSLLDLTVVAPVAFFTWNAQTFSERFRRRGLIFLMAALRPFLYSTNRKFATRVV